MFWRRDESEHLKLKGRLTEENRIFVYNPYIGNEGIRTILVWNPSKVTKLSIAPDVVPRIETNKIQNVNAKVVKNF